MQVAILGDSLNDLILIAYTKKISYMNCVIGRRP